MFTKKSTLKWYCRLCDPHINDLLTNYEKFKKVNLAIEEIRAEMREELNSKMNEFEARLKKCEKIESNPVIASVIKKVDKQPPHTDPEELQLIEKKKNNLIYFRIPESNSEENEDRMKHDFEKLKEMYGESEIAPSDVSNLFRVGKKGESPRPLIVKFKDYDTKQIFVDKTFGFSLKVKSEHEIIEIGATHDKTEKQREEAKRKRSESGATSSSGQNFQQGPRVPRVRWATVARGIN